MSPLYNDLATACKALCAGTFTAKRLVARLEEKYGDQFFTTFLANALYSCEEHKKSGEKLTPPDESAIEKMADFIEKFSSNPPVTEAEWLAENEEAITLSKVGKENGETVFACLMSGALDGIEELTA